MSSLLGIVGGLWAIVGVANLVMFDWNTSGSGLQTYAVIFNMVLFVIPGLILMGIAKRLDSRKEATSTPAALSAADRLANLDALLAAGTISQQEYDGKRAEILQSV